MENTHRIQYDRDFYAWILQNAGFIREGRFADVDVENLVEELESMGRSEKRQLVNRLAVLMAHLLKWKFQPGKRSNGWKCTIKEQRIQLVDLLEESPSLKYRLKEKFDHAYRQAVVFATEETGLDEAIFPKICPFSLEDCLNETFLPDDETDRRKSL